MAFTASDIRNFASGGTQVSNGNYKEGSNLPVPVMQKDGAFYWNSGMSIDCDGQPGSACNASFDPYFQPNTAWNQSDGKPLKAEELPYVVVPLPSSTWNFSKAGIKGGNLVVMAYKDKYVFGVVGDQGPSQRIGEASYAAAKALGINPDPKHGGVGSGVTYVVFPDVKVSPIEDREEAVRLGKAKVEEWLGVVTTPPTPPVPTPTPMKEHVVVEGESVTQIAAKYEMTVDELVAINQLMHVGQVLAVKNPDPYAQGLPVPNSTVPSAIALQNELKRTGFMAASVVVNANYGPKTQEAVAKFNNEYPQFRDPNNNWDVSINRTGWEFLRELPTKMVLKTVTVDPETRPQSVVLSPVPDYTITYPFGMQSAKYAIGYHTGDDYAAPEGKPVVAVRDGEIVWANSKGGAYGTWMGLRADNNRDYVYCHLDNIHPGATTGARVKAGQIIGYVGSTGNAEGPHLHFEDRPVGGGYGSGRKPVW